MPQLLVQPGSRILLPLHPLLSPALECPLPDLDAELSAPPFLLTVLEGSRGMKRTSPETAKWRTRTAHSGHRRGAGCDPSEPGPATKPWLRLHIFFEATIIYLHIPSTGSYSYYKTIWPHLPLILFHVKLESVSLGFLSLFFYHLNIVPVSVNKLIMGIQWIYLILSQWKSQKI